MLKRIIIASLLLLAGVSGALAQANVCINGSGGACAGPFTGTAITATGYNFAGGPLFAAPNSNLQSPTPFSGMLWVKTLGNDSFILNYDGSPFSDGFGVSVSSSYYPVGLVFQTFPNGGGNICTRTANACTRAQWVNDGNWHHLCYSMDASGHTALYVDGIFRDGQNQATSFTAATRAWTIGQTDSTLSLREIARYNRLVTPAECALAYNRGIAKFDLASGNAGSLVTGLVAWWKLGDCTGSGGTLSCPESSGSGVAALTLDIATPTCSVLTPSGTVSGSQNMTASATDPGGIGVSKVTWLVDNSLIGTSTTAPFTVALNTANYVDGSHVISAVATNFGGTSGSCSATVTTSNSVSAKTVYISAAGSDSNNCTTTGTACATMQKANSFTYHGGDSILFDHANPISVAAITIGATNSTALILAGPNTQVGAAGTTVTQNAFGVGSGYPLTVGTYNGTSTCSPLGGSSTNCATITLSGNAIASQAPMVGAYNLNYVTIQNLKVVGTGQALAGTQGIGIGFFATSGISGVSVNIQNNEAVDFFFDIVDFSASSYPSGPAFGHTCGATLQDNYAHGSTLSYAGNFVGIFALQPTTCVASATTGVTVQSNYTNNTGGGVNNGSGIAFINTGNSIIDYFNVGSNGGNNNTGCGGPYENWWYRIAGGTVKGNEGFNAGPAFNGGGCDNGIFDIDHGNSGLTLEYNYAHESYGPALSILDTSDASGQTIGGHTIRYNVFENSGSQVHDGTGAMVGSDWTGSPSVKTVFYNNNIWNGYSGLSDPYSSATSSPYAFGMQPSFAPTPGVIIANNIFVSNSVNGGAVAGMVTYSQFNPGNLNAYLTWRNNAYYNSGTNGTIFWREVNGGPGGINGPNYTSLATWAAGVVSTGEISSNPTFASPGGGQAVACYTLGSGNPTGCTTSTLPGYQLTNPGSSAFIGTGLNLTTAFGLNVGTIDFYGNTLGNGVGTGYNIGADGAHH